MSKPVYAGKKGRRGSSGTDKRKKISTRRPLNRYEFEKDTGDTSTLAKKLKTTANETDVEVDPTFGYRFINFIPVFAALAQVLVCKQCGNSINFTETSKRGLGFKIVVSCGTCNETVISNSPMIGHAYDINRRLVLAMRLIGIGHYGISKFCAFMNLPKPVFQSSYSAIVNLIATATDAVKTRSIKKAAEEEKNITASKGQTNGLTVSGDGSWRKRGFSSLYGFVSLIGWHTKKVIDVLVKSKYCKSCEHWKKKQGTAEYEEWATLHENACQANHSGSSGKMEVDAILELFRRSESLHGVRYSSYIGDGDSKTYKGIVDEKPYDDLAISKKECIGHVQKRLGTRLRNLKKQAKLGGKGKLTGKLIDELAIYYGLAIRRNSDSVENMRKDIWATLYHKISTDETPQHEKCPAGEDSWCSWQRALASNTLALYSHKRPMPMKIFNTVKKIYEDLTSDDLLSRCLGGYTQNANESFNSVVWTIAPKTISSGKTITDIATDIAVIIYNDGFRGLLDIMQVLELNIGYQLYNFCVEVDEHRVKAANRLSSRSRKDNRKDLTALRKEVDEQNLNLEGMLYGPGVAD